MVISFIHCPHVPRGRECGTVTGYTASSWSSSARSLDDSRRNSAYELIATWVTWELLLTCLLNQQFLQNAYWYTENAKAQASRQRQLSSGPRRWFTGQIALLLNASQFRSCPQENVRNTWWSSCHVSSNVIMTIVGVGRSLKPTSSVGWIGEYPHSYTSSISHVHTTRRNLMTKEDFRSLGYREQSVDDKNR